MTKKWIIVFGFFLLISSIAGIYCRGQYTDVLNDYIKSGDAGDYKVSNVLDDDLEYAREIIEEQKQELDSAEYIVKAKMAGDPESVLFSTKWKLEILEVYRGENMQKGQKVEYITVSADYSKDHKLWGRSYVNLMREGEEYLVFMNKALETDSDQMVYLSPQGCDLRYFSLSERENVAVPEECKKLDGQYYLNTVKENEFFAESRRVMEKMELLKEEMINTYVN